jgi:predicted GIY-YIG superfamily endonuclease
MEHYIYVIASKQTPVKIGITHDCEQRLKSLQTGHSDKLQIFHQESVDKDKARILEHIIHKNLKLKRSHGEWFNITVEEAIKEIQYCIITYADDPILEYKYRNKLIKG